MFSLCCLLKTILQTKTSASLLVILPSIALAEVESILIRIFICTFLYKEPEGLIANFQIQTNKGHMISFGEVHASLCFLKIHFLLHGPHLV